ncbi:MAG: SprB repeat-containing protein, partial [Bacteroidota bacterium]
MTAGTYTVTASDGNGCASMPTQVIVGSGNNLGVAQVFANPVTCPGGNDGSALVSGVGGAPPYTYTWPMGNGQLQTGLGAGAYTVTVQDASGCSGLDTVFITEPAPLTAMVSSQGTDLVCTPACEGALQVSPAGGTPPYALAWST